MTQTSLATTEVRPPDFITFTGLDARTDLERVVALSKQYPLEWGVLFSASKAGQHPRYPSADVIERVLYGLYGRANIRLAAHLCGDFARQALLWPDKQLLRAVEGFARVQVNYVPNPLWWPELKPTEQTGLPLGHHEAEVFADFIGKPVILQHRAVRSWPALDPYSSVGKTYLQFLYDLSGGKGAAPAKWPPHPGADDLGQPRRVGYAGGIGPENAAEVVRAIASTGPYWIDMEGRVRTEDDWLDLDKVEAVCRAVFPSPQSI